MGLEICFVTFLFGLMEEGERVLALFLLACVRLEHRFYIIFYSFNLCLKAFFGCLLVDFSFDSI